MNQAPRHPSIANVLRQFAHVPIDDVKRRKVDELRAAFGALAEQVADLGGPDAVVALRSLMLAKDDAIRAVIFR